MAQGRPTADTIEAMISVVSSLFTDLNLGLMIYHLDIPGEPGTLRLLYVNNAASSFTGANLEPRVGKYILDAFPGLAGTEIPGTYAEVADGGKPVELGTFEYPGDESIEHSYYSVKAFPMPNACTGVIFENITIRKQVEELVRKETGRL